MVGPVRTEVQYFFHLKEDKRIIYVKIIIKGGESVPTELFRINYSQNLGLSSGKIYVNKIPIEDYDIITPYNSIIVDLEKIDEIHPELEILKNLKDRNDVHLLLKYEENINIELEGNLSKVKLNFNSNLSSSNTKLIFCIPKISKLYKFLLNFIDITTRGPYEILTPFLIETSMFQTIFCKLPDDIKDDIKMGGGLINDKDVVIYCVVNDEKEISELSGFAYYLPKISRKKTLFAILRYFIALILGILIGNLINSCLLGNQ